MKVGALFGSGSAQSASGLSLGAPGAGCRAVGLNKDVVRAVFSGYFPCAEIAFGEVAVGELVRFFFRSARPLTEQIFGELLCRRGVRIALIAPGVVCGEAVFRFTKGMCAAILPGKNGPFCFVSPLAGIDGTIRIIGPEVGCPTFVFKQQNEGALLRAFDYPGVTKKASPARRRILESP